MQWYDKGGVSMQTICEELDLDYDAEIEKIREEQVMAGPQGQIPGGDMAGGMGGMPGGDMAGGMPGGDMGGGMPGMPGDPAAGGMPGAAPMAAPMGAPMGAAADANLPKITKRGGGSGQEEQEQVQPQAIKFTKLEQKMLKILQQIPAPHDIFAQYQVKVPGESRPFVLDFAYPQIGVGVETDGAIWHQREDFQQRDMVRDQKLANVGWRVLRFRDDAVEEQSDAVQKIIAKNMIEATKNKKSANDKNAVMKYAAIEGMDRNPIYDYMLANKGNIGINIIEMPGKMGQLILIGTV
jgi:very-short-patch-repair endonuclease